jgi:hypothetical protein
VRSQRATSCRFRAVPKEATGSGNDGDETARVLIVAANANPDVAEYPDTGKVATVIGGRHRFHRAGDEVDHAGPD